MQKKAAVVVWLDSVCLIAFRIYKQKPKQLIFIWRKPKKPLVNPKSPYAMKNAGKPYKSTFVADILHNPISLTYLEKKIIGTTVFNRLHGVKQNSTAYMTFPSLNHVRFSHSLGTAYLAGKLFSYGLYNSESSDREKFLEEVFSYLESLNVSAEIFEDYPATEKESFIEIEYLVSFFEKNDGLPWVAVHGENTPSYPSPEMAVSHILILQGVRIAALVHDLGHPPFSHVTEYALKNLYKKITNKDKATQSKSEKEFVKCLDQKRVPHEALTINLFKFLKRKILSEIKITKDADFAIGAWYSLEIADKILSDSEEADPILEDEEHERFSGIFRCLHELISSDLDADRMDYIQRDSILSGIRSDNLALQRLIYLYQLQYRPSDTESGAGFPVFAPDIRSLRSLEEFFQARYALYRNVIYHHHVVKTDALMRHMVEYLALKAFVALEHAKTEKEKNTPSARTSKNLDVSMLWRIFDNSSKSHSQHYHDKLYVQLDDSWLLGLLRQELIRLSDCTIEKLPLREKVAYYRLEELLAGKKHYMSLIKRVEDFYKVDQSLRAEMRVIIDNFSQHEELTSIDALESKLKTKKLLISSETAVKFSSLYTRSLGKDYESYEESHDESRSMSYVLNNIGISKTKEIDEFTDKLQRELIETEGLVDCVIEIKKISSGVAKDFLVVCEGTLRSLSELSQLPTELEKRTSQWPIVFVYFLYDKNSLKDRSQLISSFGTTFARVLLKELLVPFQ